MAKKDFRNIQLSDEIVLTLIKQGFEKGFKNFKSYAEYILKEQALKEKLTKLNKKS